MDTDYYLGRVVWSSFSSNPGLTVKQTLVVMVINTGDAVIVQGPLVVQRRISANPGLNFNPGFFLCIFFSKAFPRIIFSMTKRNIKLNLLFQLLFLNSNFALIQGYLNPALKNPALWTTLSRPTINYLRILRTNQSADCSKKNNCR